MKYYVLFIVLFTNLPISGHGQSLPKCGMDSTYVWAKNGLSLRAEPNKKSERIEIIPFGTRVKLSSTMYRYDSIRLIPKILNRHGKDNKELYISANWIKVEVNGMTGYVFGAYLSRIQPIGLTDEYDYSLRQFLFHHKDTSYHTTTQEKYRYHEHVVFTNGVSRTRYSTEGGGRSLYFIPGRFGFNDGFAFLNFFQEFNVSNSDLTQYDSITSSTEYNYYGNPSSIEVYFSYKEGGGQRYRVKVDGFGIYIYYAGHC